MDLSTLWDGAQPEQLLAPQFVGGLVIALVIWYVLRYLIPSYVLSARLKRITAGLVKVRDLPAAQRRGELETLFKGSKFEHSWDEYAETLHNQYREHEGERVLVSSRATSGAAHYFSPQSVVDTPLATEFFKHLPGILTGIGIVGTFFGLMLGLQRAPLPYVYFIAAHSEYSA